MTTGFSVRRGDRCQCAINQAVPQNRWSFPVRLAKLFDRSADSKKKMSAADAIDDVFGVSPYVLHERWRAYVLKTYK